MKTASILALSALGLVSASDEANLEYAMAHLNAMLSKETVEYLESLDIPPHTQRYLDFLERKEKGLLHDDAFKTITQIANENGFKCESHQVVTEDGYILGIYRIPGALVAGAEAEARPPVLLQHGLEADMMQWVYNRPEVAPALVLARAGYDVWLGNNRGTRWSNTHTKLDPKSKEYWSFDWEQMGTYDTPAVITKIKEVTGYDKVNYIGHSEGTSQIMAGAGLKPYNQFYHDNLNLAVFLAPPACMSHNRVPIFNLLASDLNRQIITKAVELLGMYNILPYNFINTTIASTLCKLFDGKLCDLMMALVADEDPTIDYTERYDVYMSNLPAGASYRNTVHYAQLINLPYEEFLRWDYESKEENIKHYG